MAEQLAGDPRRRERLRLALALGLTPRELDGWVPVERHTHFDADDNVTGWTLVERESRIDDADRGALLALLRYDSEVCDCGFHPSVATDPANRFQPGTRTCPVCAGAAVWQRILHDQDARATSKDAAPATPRPSDGRKAHMTLLSPEQAAERKGGEHGNQA